MVEKILQLAQKFDREGRHRHADVFDSMLERIASVKEPWQMTFEEFFNSLSTRPTERRMMSFDTWAKTKGLQSGVDYASPSQESTYYGDQTFGVFRQRSKSDAGKQKARESLIQKKAFLQQEYEKEVPLETEHYALRAESLADLAYAKVEHKRAIRRAVQEGKPVPQSIKDYYLL